MNKTKCLLYSLLIIFILICFKGPSWATYKRIPGLEQDPNWLIDDEIQTVSGSFNRGLIKCRPPRGGYNILTEEQKILNSWGFKARPIEEIKDLTPEPHYNMYAHPEVWGSFRINETAWEPVKPRGAMWERYMAQSERNKKECYLDDKGWLRNYKYGLPFPALDENDPQIALKLIWNYYKRFQDNDRHVAMDMVVTTRNLHHRHIGMLNSRMYFSGRTRPDNKTEDGLYQPNPQNIDFIYATPCIAPYNLRGTVPLYYRYNDPERDDDMWVYIPSIRRIRRMSTAQHQDRGPGGIDWTYDNAEGFEGHVTRFDWTYLGRKDLLIPIIARAHTYFNPRSFLNSCDQYYQRRNCYVIKCVYKNPINMTAMLLYIDPLLYGSCYSIDYDMKGREWIIQLITQGRDNTWFYAMYNDYAIDIVRKHATRAQFAYSGSEDFKKEDLTMKELMKVYAAR